MIRVVFMGTPEFAVPSLAALHTNPNTHVAAVWSQPDRPAGRGRKLQPSPVSAFATEHEIPLHHPTKMKTTETQTLLADSECDVAVVAAYGRILPEALLETPHYGCVNVHASLLPRHRGASPIAHAILEGDPETGVALMKMDKGLDTGPVFCEARTHIKDDETCGTLTARLANIGAELLSTKITEIACENGLVPHPQEDALSTYAPLLKKQDGALNFAQSAEILARRVRGLAPWPGTFAFLDGKRVQIERADPISGEGAPGTVIKAESDGVDVACGGGALRLTVVKPEGKKAMPVSAWISGRGVAIGQTFDFNQAT